MSLSRSQKIIRRRIREGKRDVRLSRNLVNFSTHERKTKTKKEKIEKDMKKYFNFD